MVKYVLLVVILVGALFGNLTLLIFEPLALFTRFMTTVVIPALNYTVNATESTLYSLAFLRPAISWLETVVRGPILPVVQPVFGSSYLVAGLFFGILALNLLADRFWCRYLCPLGGLLGWLSKISILRPLIGQTCTGCTRCALSCKPGAIKTIPATAGSSREVEIMPAECTVCLDCLVNCNKDSLGMGAVLKPAPAQEFDLSRRQFFQTIAAGATGIVLLRTNLRLRIKNSRLIRPPGVKDEQAFLSKCLRCSECMKVCPTNGLQAAQGEAGLEGLWTPSLDATHRSLRLRLQRLRTGLPVGRHSLPDFGAEAPGRHRYRRREPQPLPAVGERHALHRLRRDVPDAAKIHPAGGSQRDQSGRRNGDFAKAVRVARAVHRLRHL